MDDMELFRWILLGIGIVILVLMYALGRWRGERRKSAGPDASGQVPADVEPPPVSSHHAVANDPLDDELSELGRRIRVDEDSAHAPQADASTAPVREAGPAGGVRDAAAMDNVASEDGKIVAVFLMASDENRFTGPELMEAFAKADLEYGEMNIFHRYASDSGQRHSVFSVANAVEPGWFDVERMDGFDTPGLAMFLQLPGPIDGVAAVDSLFQCAEQLQRHLGGELRDASRSVLSRQTMGHIRDDVQEYCRRRHARR